MSIQVTTQTPGVREAVAGNDEKIAQYAAMAKKFMNKPFAHPHDVVGNFAWHEKFPYDELLVNRIEEGDKALLPAVRMDGSFLAVDFGCGPGRKVNRLTRRGVFNRVDGIDVSD